MHPIYCDIYFVLPSAFDILRYILSCRAIAICDLPINLQYIYKRVSPLMASLGRPWHSRCSFVWKRHRMEWNDLERNNCGSLLDCLEIGSSGDIQLLEYASPPLFSVHHVLPLPGASRCLHRIWIRLLYRGWWWWRFLRPHYNHQGWFILGCSLSRARRTKSSWPEGPLTRLPLA